MQALSKHANTWETRKKTMSPLTGELETNTVACIKTRLLLGVAKSKESKTKGESNMTGKHSENNAYSWASQKTKSPCAVE